MTRSKRSNSLGARPPTPEPRVLRAAPCPGARRDTAAPPPPWAAGAGSGHGLPPSRRTHRPACTSSCTDRADAAVRTRHCARGSVNAWWQHPPDCPGGSPARRATPSSPPQAKLRSPPASSLPPLPQTSLAALPPALSRGVPARAAAPRRAADVLVLFSSWGLRWVVSAREGVGVRAGPLPASPPATGASPVQGTGVGVSSGGRGWRSESCFGCGPGSHPGPRATASRATHLSVPTRPHLRDGVIPPTSQGVAKTRKDSVQALALKPGPAGAARAGRLWQRCRGLWLSPSLSYQRGLRGCRLCRGGRGHCCWAPGEGP